MRVIAIIATHNEEKLIGSCLENLRNQKCEFYIIDNDSTDSTVTIAESFRGNGLVDIERLPRNGDESSTTRNRVNGERYAQAIAIRPSLAGASC